MKKILFILIIFAAFLLESRITIFGAPPNFTLAVVYYYGFNKGETKGLLFGALIGLIADSLVGSIIGPNLLSKGIVGFLSAFIPSLFLRWTSLLGMISISIMTILDGLIVFSSRSLFQTMPTTIPKAMFIILIAALINSFIGVFVRPKDEQ